MYGVRVGLLERRRRLPDADDGLLERVQDVREDRRGHEDPLRVARDRDLLAAAIDRPLLRLLLLLLLRRPAVASGGVLLVVAAAPEGAERE
jgi:hypothetical protein